MDMRETITETIVEFLVRYIGLLEITLTTMVIFSLLVLSVHLDDVKEKKLDEFIKKNYRL